jgi:hypothetical protein
LFLLVPGASRAAVAPGQVSVRGGSTTTQALQALDEAIRRLGDPSSDYRKVLRQAVAALPVGAANETERIRGFLSRTPPNASAFPCSADFVQLRARLLVRRLRDALAGETPSRPEPAVCYASPYALDVTLLQSPATTLDIYGFDFDTVPLQMVLVAPDGFQDVTSALVLASHYHLTLKIGDGGVPISVKSQSLGLAWGHLIHHSIPLIQPATRLCDSRVETVPAKTMSYALPSRRGDRRLTTMWADALLDYSNNKLEATICTAAAERGGEAASSECTAEFLYTTDPDRVIDGVFGTLGSQFSHQRGEGNAGLTSRRAHGPVREWNVAYPKSESAKTSLTVRLNTITVVSSEDDGCIAPIAYSEAKRTTMLSVLTRQALDRQLGRIDPAILRLRPRFVTRRP